MNLKTRHFPHNTTWDIGKRKDSATFNLVFTLSICFQFVQKLYKSQKPHLTHKSWHSLSFLLLIPLCALCIPSSWLVSLPSCLAPLVRRGRVSQPLPGMMDCAELPIVTLWCVSPFSVSSPGNKVPSHSVNGVINEQRFISWISLDEVARSCKKVLFGHLELLRNSLHKENIFRKNEDIF